MLLFLARYAAKYLEIYPNLTMAYNCISTGEHHPASNTTKWDGCCLGYLSCNWQILWCSQTEFLHVHLYSVQPECMLWCIGVSRVKDIYSDRNLTCGPIIMHHLCEAHWIYGLPLILSFTQSSTFLVRYPAHHSCTVSCTLCIFFA